MHYIYSSITYENEQLDKKQKKYEQKKNKQLKKLGKAGKTRRQLIGEKTLTENKEKYENCGLTFELFRKLDYNSMTEYLHKALNKKYNKEIRFSCFSCAQNQLFDLGSITDDELEESLLE